MDISPTTAEWMLAFFRIRLGDPYVYGGVWNPADRSVGCDCSGAVGSVLEVLTYGPHNATWEHVVDTEDWHYDYETNTPAAPGTIGPFNTVAVATLADIPSDAALTINIMHGGGGQYSHMNCSLEGVVIESNGSYGTCTTGTGAYPSTSSIWTDHWYLPGPIDVDWTSSPVPTLISQQFGI